MLVWRVRSPHIHCLVHATISQRHAYFKWSEAGYICGGFVFSMWYKTFKHTINMHANTITKSIGMHFTRPDANKQFILHSKYLPPKAHFEWFSLFVALNILCWRFDMCSTCDFCHRLHVNTKLRTKKNNIIKWKQTFTSIVFAHQFGKLMFNI